MLQLHRGDDVFSNICNNAKEKIITAHALNEALTLDGGTVKIKNLISF